jgi:hypothetical protein
MFVPLAPLMVLETSRSERVASMCNILCRLKLCENTPTLSRYAGWNAYNYNQGNSAAYSYSGSGSTSAPSPGASTYAQYSEHQSSSQYPYAPSGTAAVSEYYSQYGYEAPQPAGAYADPTGK